MGRRADSGIISLLIGPFWLDNFQVSYLLDRKPQIAHHFIQQNLVYQERIQEQAEQHHQQRNEQDQWKYKFNIIRQWIRQYLFLWSQSTTMSTTI